MKESPKIIVSDHVAGSMMDDQYISHAGLNFLKLCLRKWWVFALIGLIAGIAGIFYAKSQKPQFESRLTFAIDAGSNDGLSGAMNLAAQFGFGFGSGQSMFDGDNIMEIMKSRRMIESVLLSVDTFNGKAFTIVDFYLETSDIRETLNKKPRLKNISFPVGCKKETLSYLQDSILNNVYLSFASNYISAARPDRKLSIYEVRINNVNEKFAKDFTDRLVAATSNFYTEITSKKDKETLEILEKRVSSLRGNVGSSIDEKAANQDANVNPAFAANQSPLLKQQYNMQAYGEAYKEMFKTLEIARYQYLKKIPLLQIIDPADYPMKRIMPGKLKTGILFSVIAVLLSLLFLCIFYVFKQQQVQFVQR